MTNFFKKLFGITDAPEVRTSQIAEPFQEENQISNSADQILERIFIDNEDPQPEISQKKPVTTKLMEFLNGNFEYQGLHDGFEYYSQEVLKAKVLKLKADFSLIADQMIEVKAKTIFELELQLLSIGMASPIANQQILLSIKEHKSKIVELQKHKYLVDEDNGWVMIAVNSYCDGFNQGIIKRLNESKFLTNSSNL